MNPSMFTLLLQVLRFCTSKLSAGALVSNIFAADMNISLLLFTVFFFSDKLAICNMQLRAC